MCRNYKIYVASVPIEKRDRVQLQNCAINGKLTSFYIYHKKCLLLMK